MTSNQTVSSIIIDCKSQEHLDEIIASNRKVIVLFYSYAMPWGKIGEHKMHVCARELEKGHITSIPFVLVNYGEFYVQGKRISIVPTVMIRYTAYVDGREHQSTGNSAELEGLVTALL
ncbi:hypothetical protein BGZ82_001092 [Podila clonocystis]|nr:hypothetical protein BGZ82_001092 [Podila clonocystis]